MRRLLPLRRLAVPVLALLLAACVATPEVAPSPSEPGGPSTGAPSASATAPPAAPGHELYGYLPYWNMDDAGMVEHVAATPLTTLGLFSVTHTGKGVLNENGKGYKAITGERGRAIAAAAREAGARVELVYTSFGAAKNRRLLDSPELQGTVIASLVDLAGELGVDGINVDVESLDADLVPAYGSFVADLREAWRATSPEGTVSVATGGHALGAGMAAAAALAGADRVFLMGYDYRTGRSDPGATAPLDRSDGGTASLRRSLDLYAALGVPADRLLLGLPLYGVEWPVVGPVPGAPRTGLGEAWFPRDHAALLLDPDAVPVRDEIEQVDQYLLGSDGTVGEPTPGPATTADVSAPPAGDRTWRAVYVDSPATLAPKLELANERGLAGAGWWAIGYEQGLPAYTELMGRFLDGQPLD